jgi:hypothetical protein
MWLKVAAIFAFNERGNIVLKPKRLAMSFARIAACSAAISGALLTLSAQYAAAAPALATTNVNLRQGPGTTYNVITTIPGGSTVDVGGCSGQWCQIVWQGQNGYVIATSIDQGGPGGPPPPGGGPPPPGAPLPPGAPPPGAGPGGPVPIYPGAPPPPDYAGPPGYVGPPGYGPPVYVCPPYCGYAPYYYGRYRGYRGGYYRRHW